MALFFSLNPQAHLLYLLNMRYLLTALLLLPVLVSAQELHTFKNGEVADADKLNESLQYILNNASGGGGCSATQQDNSVVIECADGTSGVIAGAGTVVVYPEGELAPGDPVIYPTGDIVAMDANDVVLAKASALSSITFALTVTEAGQSLVLTNLTDSQEVLLTGGTTFNTWIYFRDSACGGNPFVSRGFGNLIEVGGTLYAWTPDTGPQNLLMKSRKQGAMVFRDTGQYYPNGECENGTYTVGAVPAAVFTPAPEILNAAYPVRLEQLP